jgi:Domain of unknown function (DUF4352)
MKRTRGRALLGVAAAIVTPILVGADSCSSASNEGSTASSSASGSGTAAAASTFKVGNRIKVGTDNYFFTVTGVQSSAGTDFEKPSKGQYLIVNVSFDNQSGKSQTVSSIASFELRDDAGQSYSETIFTDAPKPPDGEIATNDKLAGALTFDVPTGLAYRLYFKNDLFASGQIVVDLGAH